MSGHVAEFTMWAVTIESHPEDCDVATCDILATLERMKLGDGRMPVQGTYVEMRHGWERRC